MIQEDTMSTMATAQAGNPGLEQTAKPGKKSLLRGDPRDSTTPREAALALGLLGGEDYDRHVDPHGGDQKQHMSLTREGAPASSRGGGDRLPV